MKALEKMGLCKVDVLGLETLSILQRAADIIRDKTGDEIELDNIPLDDRQTFEMLARGDTEGVFQFAPEGFRAILRKLQPETFEDLIAAEALYRPGPLDAGWVDVYIECKNGRQVASYLHPMVKSILAETHGLILYQEQIMTLAQTLARFSLSDADLMRRALGKKHEETMENYRQRFVEGSHNTVGTEIAEAIFKQIESSAAYGFSKSHAACYAYLAYQTAYLKCHYPEEYMAAVFM